MRQFSNIIALIIISVTLHAQQVIKPNLSGTLQGTGNNIYAIKKQFLYQVLHNPAETGKDMENDNELTRFNRWFYMAEPRCYPSGNLPEPDILVKEWKKNAKDSRNKEARTTFTLGPWEPVGPFNVPTNTNGIGRINSVVIDPLDTNTLYIGAACGGVYISHDGGITWTSNSDNFPSLSIADIAVNPVHTDTIYAATGDGYGYTTGLYNIFWGGLYSAGIMMSADGGNTWNTTGLSYAQSSNIIVQKLLLHPRSTNILLAATSNGIMRTTDAGNTWTSVATGHIFSMSFYPGRPDTVYAINDANLLVSHDAGATWSVLFHGINTASDRCTIAVSPVSPQAIWVLDANNNLQWSHDGGNTFTLAGAPDTTASFYGYYDRVLAVSPIDSNYVIAAGAVMALSTNGGANWAKMATYIAVHVDNHSIAINQLHPSTIYSGNDGGIFVTHDGGANWTNLSDGLMISQLYGVSSSRQNPYLMLTGLQDNGTFRFDGTNWVDKNVGVDGMAVAIHPLNDSFQILSSVYGDFSLSLDQGDTFNYMNVTPESGAWVSPVTFDPNNTNIIYCGYQDIFRSTDRGLTFTNLTDSTLPFPNGAISLAVAPANSNVIYAADYDHILRTTDFGVTWTNVTGALPTGSAALTDIAIDYSNPMLVYVTMSGYVSGTKVYYSTSGGTTWTNISYNLPNLPVNCIVPDSSTPGALFAGTDIGVYYTDSSQPGNWTIYSSGLPNVIANGLDINYTNHKIRVATYGRGIWEDTLKRGYATGVNAVKSTSKATISVYPNPSTNTWRLLFSNQKPFVYSVTVYDMSGRIVHSQNNYDLIDASGLAPGVYNINVKVGNSQYSIKAVRE